MRVEVLIGRSIALALHPSAAWRLRRRDRALLVAAYVAGSYTIVLTLLFAF